MKNFYLKTLWVAVLLMMLKPVSAQLTENFNNITNLTGSGWFMQNNSTVVGTTNWFQGSSTVFNAFNGAATAYIAANFNNTTLNNDISNWLVTPNFTIKNGDVVKFYTRRVDPDTAYPDRLQFRMSTNGTSTNVGTGPAAVGDFTTLLLNINPTLILGVYPVTWTQYTITISGLTAPTSGRFAFRYYVTSGGPTGLNGDYIGIDNFIYTPYVCPTFTLGPPSLPNGTAGVVYNQSLSQTGALGAPTFTVAAGSLPPGVTLSSGGALTGTPNSTGTFNFTVTVNDASGCTGSSAYSITVNCPTNGATLATLPSLCTNGSLYTLIEGTPTGGIYSGTGVSAGSFDPSVGSQTVTYTLTDTYGCLQKDSALVMVNPPPVVQLTAFDAACSNIGLIVLTGGDPTGGIYSGTGISGGSFDPLSGTQTITYTYTDANGCTSSDSQTLTVNTAPTATLDAFADLCSNASAYTLIGGLPAGGVYSGTGVSLGSFNPSAGTQTITYTYTDANNCSGIDSKTITVNTAPTVTLAAFADVCIDAAPFTLTGGTPAGGTYSGTGVTAGVFNPAVGTQTITYTYTDANTCTNAASKAQTVLPCAGIAENSFASDVSCYPNPNNGKFTLSFALDNTSDITIRLLTLEGKMVYATEYNNYSGPVFNEDIDLNGIAAGLFVLQVQSGN